MRVEWERILEGSPWWHTIVLTEKRWSFSFSDNCFLLSYDLDRGVSHLVTEPQCRTSKGQQFACSRYNPWLRGTWDAMTALKQTEITLHQNTFASFISSRVFLTPVEMPRVSCLADTVHDCGAHETIWLHWRKRRSLSIKTPLLLWQSSLSYSSRDASSLLSRLAGRKEEMKISKRLTFQGFQPLNIRCSTWVMVGFHPPGFFYYDLWISTFSTLQSLKKVLL
jgi:hypothetical protein